MNNPKVYLAGPITGLSYGGCTDWREFARGVLAPEIDGVSPMRGKEYLAQIAKISGTGEEYAHLGAMSLPQAVMARDHFDTTRADVVLCNFLGATTLSVGTIMEVAWAFTHQIPIIAAIEDTGNVHNHMMFNEAIRTFRVPTLEQALHMVRIALNTGVKA